MSFHVQIFCKGATMNSMVGNEMEGFDYSGHNHNQRYYHEEQHSNQSYGGGYDAYYNSNMQYSNDYHHHNASYNTDYGYYEDQGAQSHNNYYQNNNYHGHGGMQHQSNHNNAYGTNPMHDNNSSNGYGSTVSAPAPPQPPMQNNSNCHSGYGSTASAPPPPPPPPPMHDNSSHNGYGSTVSAPPPPPPPPMQPPSDLTPQHVAMQSNNRASATEDHVHNNQMYADSEDNDQLQLPGYTFPEGPTAAPSDDRTHFRASTSGPLKKRI